MLLSESKASSLMIYTEKGLLMCMDLHWHVPAEQLNSRTASFTANFAATSEAGNNTALNLVVFRTGNEEFQIQ